MTMSDSSPKKRKRNDGDHIEGVKQPPKKVTVRPQLEPSNRSEEKFNFLRSLQDGTSMETLESMIGQFIEVPIISTQARMRPLRGNLTSVLLTRKMVDILKEVVYNGTRNFGFALAGPSGIGKSTIMYMIAGWAYVNSYPLLYVVSEPKCV
jgi:ABC-type glutathione transport system ATPase component